MKNLTFTLIFAMICSVGFSQDAPAKLDKAHSSKTPAVKPSTSINSGLQTKDGIKTNSTPVMSNSSKRSVNASSTSTVPTKPGKKKPNTPTKPGKDKASSAPMSNGAPVSPVKPGKKPGKDSEKYPTKPATKPNTKPVKS